MPAGIAIRPALSIFADNLDSEAVVATSGLNRAIVPA